MSSMTLQSKSSSKSADFAAVWQTAHNLAHQTVVDDAIRLGFISGPAEAGKLNGIAGHVGACGFAWVSVAGNSAFLKWLKTQPNERVHRDDISGKGTQIYWVYQYNQCMMWKQIYAQTLASVLRDELGLDASAKSRMD